jgi:hypothetical protein
MLNQYRPVFHKVSQAVAGMNDCSTDLEAVQAARDEELRQASPSPAFIASCDQFMRDAEIRARRAAFYIVPQTGADQERI